MDWSKAKSILIVALIVTNSLLGYVLFLDQNNVDATVDKNFIAETIRILEDKNIGLSTKIPDISPSLNGLTVEYEVVNAPLINENYFNNKGTIKSSGEAILEVLSNDEIVTIVNKKLLIYESKTDDIIYDIGTEDDALEVANRFLKDRKYSLSDMRLSLIREIDGVYNIEFTKIYEDNYLESSFTNITLNNKGVRKLERTWLNVKEEGTNPIYISSAPKSVLSLISMEEVYGKTIKDISLCYYFDPKKHEYIEDPIEAKQGRAIPAWRIQFEDGYKVFIDNY